MTLPLKKYNLDNRLVTLYLISTSVFFLLLNIKFIAINQLSLVYLFLFAAFLFNRQSKLQPDWDWLIYGTLLCLVIYLSFVGAQHPEHAIIKTTLLRDLGLLGFAFYLTVRNNLAFYADFFLLAMVIAFLVVTPITLWEYLSAAQ